MSATTLLGEARLRALVPLDLAAIDQIESAFLSLAGEQRSRSLAAGCACPYASDCDPADPSSTGNPQR